MAAAMPDTTLGRFSHMYFTLEISLLLLFITAVHSIEVSRPRGVPLARASLYDPAKNFTCFDGSASFAFHQVNDDYCDCRDGSDEPGTAACNNGVFHCSNLGHRGENIPASRVNDGICDCCDGTDEYGTSAECTDNCLELGKYAREEEERRRELRAQGLQMQQQMSREGRQHKEQCKTKLEQLRLDLEEVRKSREALEAVKKEAEDRENQALQKYRDIDAEKKREQEELEMRRHQEEEKANAEEAFNALDLDMDGVLTAKELQENPIFDQNRDNTVSLEEAKFFLHMKDEMKLDEFVLTGWMIMKPIYAMSQATPIPDAPEATTPMPPADKEEEEKEAEPGKETEQRSTEEEEAEEDVSTEQDEDEEDLEPPEFPPKDKEATEPAEPSKYDPETQELIDAAKKARDEHKEAEDKFRDIESEIRKLETTLETDYGPEEEFAALREQCFEFSDREYTYKLCPFDQAAQIPKNGGSETNLGRWGSWSGPEGNKYASMKLDGGMACWNGPSRSVVVDIHCGLENQLTSASEPNRCEYHFDFSTPAACSDKVMAGEEGAKPHHAHEEL
uniref:Glucosidase 2 subunit beta n=1 Tax=Ixodes scapularis TaxID=6945 RepID=A0A4D5RQM7_IXOSC